MISLQNERQDIEDQAEGSTYKVQTVMRFCLTTHWRNVPQYLLTCQLYVHLSLQQLKEKNIHRWINESLILVLKYNAKKSRTNLKHNKSCLNCGTCTRKWLPHGILDATLWYHACRYSILRTYTKEAITYNIQNCPKNHIPTQKHFFQNKSFLSSTMSVAGNVLL